jgi:hypothetical protein
MSERPTAELLADRGAAAESDEFFRSRQFLDAERVTHTLRIDTGDTELLAPLIVRDIPMSSPLTANGAEKGGLTLRDAVSPYGYPGLSIAASDIDHTRTGSMSDAAIDPSAIDFSATGLVSVFLRHTLAEPPPLSGTSERNVVQIADPELPRKSRPSDRNQVNKNRRAGYEVELVAGTDSTPEQREGFLAAYEQTMRRTAASERYFFDAAYFDRILESPRATLALASAPGGEIAAASIAVRSDGALHYYLSGSADSHLRDSPMKNVLTALVDLSIEQGLPLNLGGGISSGDRLEEFKRGFANREQPWRTSEVVCDTDAYARLSAGLEAGGFFPAYRAGPT